MRVLAGITGMFFFAAAAGPPAAAQPATQPPSATLILSSPIPEADLATLPAIRVLRAAYPACTRFDTAHIIRAKVDRGPDATPRDDTITLVSADCRRGRTQFLTLGIDRGAAEPEPVMRTLFGRAAFSALVYEPGTRRLFARVGATERLEELPWQTFTRDSLVRERAPLADYAGLLLPPVATGAVPAWEAVRRVSLEAELRPAVEREIRERVEPPLRAAIEESQRRAAAAERASGDLAGRLSQVTAARVAAESAAADLRRQLDAERERTRLQADATSRAAAERDQLAQRLRNAEIELDQGSRLLQQTRRDLGALQTSNAEQIATLAAAAERAAAASRDEITQVRRDAETRLEAANAAAQAIARAARDDIETLRRMNIVLQEQVRQADAERVQATARADAQGQEARTLAQEAARAADARAAAQVQQMLAEARRAAEAYERRIVEIRDQAQREHARLEGERRDALAAKADAEHRATAERNERDAALALAAGARREVEAMRATIQRLEDELARRTGENAPPAATNR